MTHPDQQQSVLRDAIVEMRRLRAELDTARGASATARSPIAVVGMAARLPGAASTAEFWDLLIEGRSGIGEIPADRWDTQRFYSPNPDEPGTMYTNRAGLLRDVAGFDAGFFGISPREAAALDPQQRLLLEVGWEAIEDAGINPDRLAGTSTGVFYGVTGFDYLQEQLQALAPAELQAYSLTSNASTFAAGRTSYWLGLNGPSLSVDTACSSSLVGVHLACQSLRSGECDAALAGGVNVLLSPEWFVVLSRAKMLAADGRCKTFDAAADGYVRSEGCGVVLLKRLADAERDGDRILGVLLGSAVNQDGRSGGITVPNSAAQQAVIRQALAQAEVEPAAVDYVEAHGTGTSLGDPIELRALNQVLGDRPPDRPLLVGSVKTNVGHLEPAAGIAGLIKVVLALGHEQLPPHRNLQTINPAIGIDELALRIPVRPEAWPRTERPRIAGVSAFGASGTNSHVVIAEPPAAVATEPAAAPDRDQHVLALSAKEPAALRALAERFADRLDGCPPAELPDLCFTANTGRAQFAERLAVVGGSPAELAAELRDFAAGRPSSVSAGRTSQRDRRQVVFLFTGQGSQYPGMAADLYRTEPVFRQSMDRFERLSEPLLGRSMLSLIADSGAGSDPTAQPELHQTRYTQPALFAIEYSLAELWRHWGIEPTALLGHSVGELVAGCVAGVLSVEDGFALAAGRGRLMHELGVPAAMASLPLDEDGAAELIGAVSPALAVTAVNGPQNITVAGPVADVERLIERCAEAAVTAKRLPVDRGFHSPLIEPALVEFERLADQLPFAAPTIPIYSNVTGQPLDKMTASYLRTHACKPVLFQAGVRAALADGHRTFLELGATASLTGMTRLICRDGDIEATALASLRPRRSDWSVLLNSLAALWVAGHPVDWTAFDAGRDRRRLALPTYPFQRERHWFDSGTQVRRPRPVAAEVAGEPSQRLQGQRLSAPLDIVQYEAVLDSGRHDCLADCVIDGVPVVNIGVYLEAVVGACREVHGQSGSVSVTDLSVLRGLTLEQGARQRTQLLLSPTGEQAYRFGYFSAAPDGGASTWREHVRGHVTLGRLDAAVQPPPTTVEPVIPGEHFYRLLWRRNLYLGPAARWVRQLWQEAEGCVVAELRPPLAQESRDYLLPPGLTDAMFQAMFGCLPAGVAADAAYMIVSLDRFNVHAGPPADVPTYCRVRLVESSRDNATFTADAVLFDGTGRCLVEATGVSLTLATRQQLTAGTGQAPARSATFAVGGAIGSSDAAGVATVPAALDAPAIGDVVRAVMAQALGTRPELLAMDEPLRNLGLDSLMALEIKDSLTGRLGVSLPLVTFLDAHDVTAVVEIVLRRSAEATGDRAGAGPEGSVNRSPGGASTGGTLPVRQRAALVPAPEHRYEQFELTDLQQAYLVGRSGAFELGETSTYFYLEVELGELDLDRFSDALAAVVQRHDMLRAVMTPDGFQRVLPTVERYQVRVQDLRGLTAPERDRQLAELSAELGGLVLDAGRWPLFDIRATLLDEGWTRLHVGFDALIIDAWSTMLLLRELADEYRGIALPPAAEITFRDYTQAIQAAEAGPEHARAAEYWQQRLDTLPAAPQLPTAVDPALLGETTFTHRAARLSPTQWATFRRHAAELGVTASTALCTAYAQVLASRSGSPSFTLNLLFFNRRPVHPDVEKVIGNFSATTLLEVHSPAGEPFAARAERLQRQLWQDLEHSEVTGVEVLRELNRRQGSSGRASMPVVFASTVNFGARDDSATFTGLSQHLIEMAGSGREVHSAIRTPQVWLDHQVVEDHGALVLNWDCVDAIFPAGMVDRMFADYVEVVTDLATRPEAWLQAAQPAISADELLVRALVNDTGIPAPSGLLHQAFLDRAAEQPDQPAVLSAERELSYRELDADSDLVARWLLAEDLPPQSLVPIVMRKGWQQLAAALGVLKAGHAYVPIDAGIPAERLNTLLVTCQARAVLTQPDTAGVLAWPDGLSRHVVRPADPHAGHTDPVPTSPASAHDLAYVIFTSGSTGVPKGVMIDHAGAVNTITQVNARYQVSPQDRVLALSALNFDLSVYDVFGLLAAGGAVVLPAPDDHREPGRWLELVSRYRVSIWNTVPTLMEMFTEACLAAEADVRSVRLVMMSGDWIPVSLPGRIGRLLPEAEVWSLGGATEASIWSIWYRIDAVDPSWGSIPYGTPMPNQRFHVLDADLRPQPDWVPGDLYIAGAGLARGYLADEAKTRASFLRHPVTGERLYRTGDRGRYRPDGVIEFLGRDDLQVKVGGYRIELGEVEAALLRCPGVRSAVAVAAGPRTGVKRLVGYVVAEQPDRQLDSADILARLAEVLPDYEVPQTIVQLPTLPLTSNGKVDRSALPDSLDVPAVADVVEAPRGDSERMLLALWQDFFPGKELGVTQSFFDLGGNSLLAVRLMAGIRRQTGRTLPLSVLFSHPTIRQLSEVLADTGAGSDLLLVLIRSGEAPVPLVLIHPVGGDVLCYAELVGALGGDEPVYGLRAPAADAGLDTVTELAACYAEQLRATLPGGRYRLGGWSMGGVLALELARQLTELGDTVERVLLIDLAEPPGTTDELTARPESEPDAADLLAWFARDLAGLAGDHAAPTAAELRAVDDPLAAVLDWAHAGRVLAADIGRDIIEPLYARFARNLLALLRHRPHAYGGPSWLLSAEQNPHGAAEVSRAWLDLLPPSTPHVHLPGDHFSIMRRPGLAALVAELRAALESRPDDPGRSGAAVEPDVATTVPSPIDRPQPPTHRAGVTR